MQADLSEILEQELKGIHLPEPVSWWPLAPGWWVLIAFALFCSTLIFIAIRHRVKRNAYRKSALSELLIAKQQWQQNQNVASYLQSVNAILKRCTFELIEADSTDSAALSLSGESWATFLNQYATTPLSEEALTALSHSVYQADPNAEVEPLHAELYRWVRTHKLKKLDTEKAITPEANNA